MQAAAEAAVRRAKASNLEAWLRDMCEIDDDEERMEVLDVFVDPRYRGLLEIKDTRRPRVLQKGYA